MFQLDSLAGVANGRELPLSSVGGGSWLVATIQAEQAC